ncbi:DUF1127 domain-containing protein [Rhizobium sp. FKY42]|uniref:DUF1127 domain-containing protein n=1 Tax=Rhizobium sp. FKY42 TaxID=2562310 RepID=UPI0010C0B61F|nr:DUF1127 domain-containing protein [Rhizobium sp. FKY42]
MRKSQVEVAESLNSVVTHLFQQFGLWALLRALWAAILLEQQKKNDLRQLSDRMLRDIGAEGQEDHLRPKRFSPWDIRF